MQMTRASEKKLPNLFSIVNSDRLSVRFECECMKVAASRIRSSLHVWFVEKRVNCSQLMKHDSDGILCAFIKCSFALNAKCVDDVHIFELCVFVSVFEAKEFYRLHMKCGWMKTCSCFQHGMDSLPTNSFKHQHHIAAHNRVTFHWLHGDSEKYTILR